MRNQRILRMSASGQQLLSTARHFAFSGRPIPQLLYAAGESLLAAANSLPGRAVTEFTLRQAPQSIGMGQREAIDEPRSWPLRTHAAALPLLRSL